MDYVNHKYFSWERASYKFIELCRPADSALNLGRQSETKFNQIRDNHTFYMLHFKI